MAHDALFTRSSYLQYVVDTYANGAFTVSDLLDAYEDQGIQGVEELMYSTGFSDENREASIDVLDVFHGSDYVHSALDPLELFTPEQITEVMETVTAVAPDMQGLMISMGGTPIPDDFANILNAVSDGFSGVKDACKDFAQGFQNLSGDAGSSLCADLSESYKEACSDKLKEFGLSDTEADSLSSLCTSGCCASASCVSGGPCGGCSGSDNSRGMKACKKDVFEEIEQPVEDQCIQAERNMRSIARSVGGCPGFCSSQSSRNQQVRSVQEDQKRTLESPPACQARCAGGAKSSCGGNVCGGCGGEKQGCGGTPKKPILEPPSVPSDFLDIVKEVIEKVVAMREGQGSEFTPDPVEDSQKIHDAANDPEDLIWALNEAGIGLEPTMVILASLGIFEPWITRVGIDSLGFVPSLQRIIDTVTNGSLDLHYMNELYQRENKTAFEMYLASSGVPQLNRAAAQDIRDILAAYHNTIHALIGLGFPVAVSWEVADIFAGFPTLIQGVLVSLGVSTASYQQVFASLGQGYTVANHMFNSLGIPAYGVDLLMLLLRKYVSLSDRVIKAYFVWQASQSWTALDVASKSIGAYTGTGFGGSCGGCSGGA